MGSALNSPGACADQAQNSKVELTFFSPRSVSLTPRVLSLRPLSSDTCSRSARYLPAARKRCGRRRARSLAVAPAAGLSAALLGAATGLELPAASALGCGWAEPVAAMCGAEGDARSRPRELS